MHKLLLSFIISLLALNAVGQLVVGVPRGLFAGTKVSDEHMRILRNTSTVYFYGKKDSAVFAQYGEEIKRFWKLNKLIFAPSSDVEKYLSKPWNYSYFKHSTETITKTSSSGYSYVSTLWVYLDLVIPTEKGYKPISRVLIAPDIKDLIELYQDYLDEPEVVYNDLSDFSKQIFQESAVFLREEAQYTNLYPGIFMIYLKEINDKLRDGQTHGALAKPEDESQIRVLAEKTLIVPDGILTYYKKVRDDFYPRDREEFFKHYPYPYEIKTYDEISEMLLTEKHEDKFILVPVISNTDQFLNIYSSTGDWIYHNMDALTKDYSSKDMKKIAKAIAKAQ